MYLKEIVATGFKSFAEKFSIKLDDQVTCIVGPNGSGKSNVVDAVRWVLGEQSVKSLRGDGSMSDVIFSGSNSRKALNVASVELIFDNSDHLVNIPYLEISIKRRIYRSGENEYYLNNQKCRLKDINNLLMDTGMGIRSLNIISQGEIDKILSNSSSERRIVFEEAAGILKYRKRKEEALRKLDRTHANIERINDIINELKIQLEPLEKQKEEALKYKENKEGLDKYEVALLVFDIKNLTAELKKLNEITENLNKEIIDLSNETTLSDTNHLSNTNQLNDLEIKRNKLQNELLNISTEVEKINGERNLLQEKINNTKSKDDTLINVKKTLEEKTLLNREIEVLKNNINQIITKSKEIDKVSNDYENNFNKLKLKRNIINSDIEKLSREVSNIKHNISVKKHILEEGGSLPQSVKKVLNNNLLTGIHNTIINVIEVKKEYEAALDIALASSKNFIICENETSAKKAINYLKEEKAGRATFFPLDVIKSRKIDLKVTEKIENDNNFIGILSDLVKYNKKYENIILNQLGLILVTSNMDSAIKISNIVDKKYKIVTLEGDVIHIGGVMSGGSKYQSKSNFTIKEEIRELKDLEDTKLQRIKSLSKEDDELRIEISKNEEKVFGYSKEKVELKEQYDYKSNELKIKEERFYHLTNEWENLDAISKGSIDSKESELMILYQEKLSIKEKIENELSYIIKNISLLKESIEEVLVVNKFKFNKLKSLEKTVKDNEINISKIDIKIDNMLNILNEDYEMTYEGAKDKYFLDCNPEDARRLVNTYKQNIKSLGMVNLSAIEEYEKINTRYSFLTKQKEDLAKAEDTLLDIMNEMDDIMKNEFISTFDKIQIEFKTVFKELFGGGIAKLELTDPENILTTGIEINVSPPGKKLSTINLLSGGEKTLTAISLLFAILNVRKIPFCLFDEIEAALDDANVIGFGTYLEKYKTKTQFLIITHKKKTMEYANTLYGITMQESGVSKLVSVKLD